MRSSNTRFLHKSNLQGQVQGVLRKQFRFETTETGTETSFGTIRNKTFVSVVSLLYRNREFDVSIEPKQTGDQPKQFDREHILLFFSETLQFFRYFFEFFWFFSRIFSFFSVCFETVCFDNRNREFRLNRNKQKNHPTV